MTRRITLVGRLTIATLTAAMTLTMGTATLRAQTTRVGDILATISVGIGPVAVAVDTHLGHAFVLRNARYTTGTVSMLDSRSGAVLRTVAVDQGPQAIAVDAGSNHVFVSTVGSTYSVNAGAVTMLDAGTNAVLRTVRVPRPIAMALDTRTHRLFVVNTDTRSPQSTAYVFDTRSGAIVRTVQTGRFALAIAVDGLTGHAFVANFGDGTVTMLDAATGDTLRTSSLGASWPGSGDAATAIAVDERAGRVFVSTLGSPTLYVLDATTGALAGTVHAGQNSLAIAVDESLGRVFVTNEGPVDAQGNLHQRGTVRVFDAGTGRAMGIVRVGTFPAAIAIDAMTGRAFIFKMADPSITIIDARTTTVLRTIAITATRVAGIDPLQQAVAVDDSTGHTFAVNIGKTRVTMLDTRATD